MKLQIALDTVDTGGAKALLERLDGLADIAEVGTPMLLHYGMEPVRALRAAFPGLVILADTKIMDAGEYEAAIAYEAGADIATVMGVTNDETVRGCVAAARKAGKKVMADMMCVERLADRAKELAALGVDYICVHAAVDIQARHDPYGELAVIQEAVGSACCAIAGGLSAETVSRVAPYAPEIVIVGNGVTGAADPKAAAKAIKDLLDGR